MKISLPSKILFASLLALTVLTARADDEQSQFAILHSDAGVSQKWQACQKLRVIGTAKAVPEVAALLTDEKLSQAARQTLDGLPYPEVDDALRDALGKTSGLLKAGIIDTIGWRGKTAAVPVLTSLLSDSDADVAAAAATALGRIGGQEAVTALTAALDPAPAPVQAAVEASLLQCAGRLTEKHDYKQAVAIYHRLNDDKYPMGIRTAAWDGLVQADSSDRVALMTAALTGTDHALERVALKVLRDSNDRHLIEGCMKEWDSLPIQAQLALIDTQVKLGGHALSSLRATSKSTNPQLRTEAWTALGELNDLGSIPAFAQAAATTEPAERDAARDSLARLQGPRATKALLKAVDHAQTPELTELLRALGARQDKEAWKVLVHYAGTGEGAVREVALQSLTQVAAPEALPPLLEISQQSGMDDLHDQLMETLSAICQAYPDKEAATTIILDKQKRGTPGKPGALLPLMAQLGTPGALAAAQAASQSQDVDLAKEAVRVLAQWPNSAPAHGLLELARTASNNALRTLALRGAIAVAGQEPSVATRLALLKEAMAEASRADERKQALGQIGQIPTAEALDVALAALSDPDVNNEASLAALNIAEKLAKSNPEVAAKASAAVLENAKGAEFFSRAWALRPKSAAKIPFLRDWVMCGPYSQSGIIGATALFDIPFGPEVGQGQVEWKTVPSTDEVDLAGLFPDMNNCVVYLRTTIVAPDDGSAVLLLGSDDGVKAWLNGTVVHANNVDRPKVVDQDVAPVKIKKGDNELVLKITQGGGGWGACARIVGLNGSPIPGLDDQRPTGPSGPLTNAQ